MKSRSVHREAMFLKIEQWKQSGLTQKHFCDQQAIAYHIFHYWHKRYRDQSYTSKTNDSTFVQLQIKEEGHQPLMELLLNNGNRVIFYQPVSIEYFQLLIG